MKPRTARKILLAIFVALFLLTFLYFFVLEPMQVHAFRVLFYIMVIALLIGYFVILNKYYRCTECGRRLTVAGKVSFQKECPYCGTEIE